MSTHTHHKEDISWSDNVPHMIYTLTKTPVPTQETSLCQGSTSDFQNNIGHS